MSIKNIVLIIASILFFSCKTAQSKIVTKKPQIKPKIAHQQPNKPANGGTNIGKEERQSQTTQKTEVLVATSKIKVTPEVVNAYINQFKEIAIESMQKNGIPASITLAQGILESGAGTGTLSVKANNHFGIKCHKEWTGPSVSHDDDALQECFRKYENPNQSYADHAYFLTSRPRYSNLFKLQKSDYKAWAKGLRAAGYATDIKYPEKLISLIERYHLQNIDNQVLDIVVDDYKIGSTPENSAEIPVTETYIVEKGDTLFSISKKLNTTIDILKQKNNLPDNTLSVGQVLQIN